MLLSRLGWTNADDAPCDEHLRSKSNEAVTGQGFGVSGREVGPSPLGADSDFGDAAFVTRRSAPRWSHLAMAVSLVVAVSLLMLACGSSDADPGEFAASCTISRSEMGPFAPDQPLGESLGEAAAQSQMQSSGYDEWIEISAEGNWDSAWKLATDHHGDGVHVSLSWLDVDGTIVGLYADAESLGFNDLRVSRSFQGKIEHDRTPLFVGVDPERDANFDASCSVTAVDLGDEANENISNVLDLVRIEP